MLNKKRASNAVQKKSRFKTRLLIRMYCVAFLLISSSFSSYAVALILKGESRGYIYLCSGVLLVVAARFCLYAFRTGLVITDSEYIHKNYHDGNLVRLKPDMISHFSYKEDSKKFGILSLFDQQKNRLDTVYEKYVDNFHVIASWAKQNWDQIEGA